ncbi:MAG TPA: phosphopantetheine-binding protein [Steroidobacteraceae bacterium]|nr:phosphopantetheine-binding protein [Steroidobacteraceae bacterium]
MDDNALRTDIIALLQRIAPEIDGDTLDPKSALRDQVDLDSVDFLNFLISLHEKFRVEIPEADYEKLRSLDDIASYVAARAAPS